MTLHEAVAAAQSVEDENTRARTIKEVVTALAQAGFPERALQAAQEIQENIFLVMALLSIVSASAQPEKEVRS